MSSRPLAAFFITACLLPTLFITACAPLRPQQVEGALWRPSPNFDQRRANFVVLHQTGSDNVDHALNTLTDPLRKVSAHYLISRDGSLLQLVDENYRAWHAGESWWGGNTDLNSSSIGIELDNDGVEPFSEAQIASLLKLLTELRERQRIPPANVIAHGDIAPTRKVDPGPHFPWQKLASQGFGLWCDSPPATAGAGFDAQAGLAALGYDPLTPAAARQAFRRHFGAALVRVPPDPAAPQAADAVAAAPADRGELDVAEQALLYCLLQAKASAQRRVEPPPGNGKNGS